MMSWLGRLKLVSLAALAALALAGAGAQAAITCSISPPSAIAFAYVANTGTASATNVQQGSVSVTCTRTSSGDSTSLTLAVNNGLYGSNVQLSAGGTNYQVSYALYRDSSCSSGWDSNPPTRLSATLPAALNTPVTAVFSYWACKTTAQALTSYPAGLYTDRVDLTLRTGNTSLATGSINVSLYAPALCTLGSGPANLSFSYAAFAPTAAFAGTSFRANCTNLLPYTMTLSPAVGVVAGLRYSLGLSLSQAGTAANTGPASLSAQGTAVGFATHYINGAMPEGQPGQSGPVVPQIHTLTITY